MTAKYPSARRRITAASLTLPLILAFAVQSAVAAETNADTAATTADAPEQVEGGS